MSLFRRSPAVEKRAVTSVPWSHGPTLGDTTGTLEGSLSLIPVYGAVQKLSGDFSTLPAHRYRKTPAGRMALGLPAMLAKPANKGTVVDWMCRYITSQLLRGNAYGLLVGGDPREVDLPGMIQWLHPDKIQPYKDHDWLYEGRFVPGGDILHVPGMALPGSRLGVSPMTAARMLVDTGADAQKMRRDWTRNRAVPGLMAKNTAQTLTSDEAQTAKERMRATIRSGDPLVTGSDWDIELLQLSADDAGFAANAKLDATQVEVIYGLPPGKLGGDPGGSLTYATRDMNALEYVLSLNPHLIRFEQAINTLLTEGEYIKLNVNGLLRADVKTRMETAKTAREIGLNNIDELRAFEDEEPLPDGEGLAYTPLEQLASDSPAKLIQQMYLGVGKVITADEARKILKAAGVEIDDSVTLEQLHANLPPAPTQEDLALKEST